MTKVQDGGNDNVEVLDDAISIVSAQPSIAMSTKSVMQFTESLVDELCVGVENDLLGKDDTYKAMVQDYRNNKHQYHSTSIIADGDTVLSSSLGSTSHSSSEDDDASLEKRVRSEILSDHKRTKAIIQALLFGSVKNRKQKQQNAKKKDVAVAKVEPVAYSSVKETVNLDSVEVESIEDAASSVVNSKTKKEKSARTAATEAASVTDTAVNTDESSAEEVEVEHSVSEETQEGKDVITVVENMADRVSLFPSVIDAGSVYTELSPHTLERHPTLLTTRRVPSDVSKLISNHIQQRRAIYVWSLSVLRHKLEEQHQLNPKEIDSLFHGTDKPQSIQEYDQSILLALGYAMNESPFSDDGSAFDLMETKSPRWSRYMATVSTKSKSARHVVKQKFLATRQSLTLRKQVLKPGEEKPEIDWQKFKQDLQDKAVLTTKKSIRFVKNEAILDAMYIAIKLKKRAIKLHETLSVLPLHQRNMRSTSNKSIVSVSSFDPLAEDESVSDFSSMLDSSSVQGSSVSSSVESYVSRDLSFSQESQSIQYQGESVEVFGPLPSDLTKPTMKRKLSKAFKRQLSEWKMLNPKKMTKRLVLVRQLSDTSKTASLGATEKLEDSVLFLMDQDDEEAEVIHAFEVAAM